MVLNQKMNKLLQGQQWTDTSELQATSKHAWKQKR